MNYSVIQHISRSQNRARPEPVNGQIQYDYITEDIDRVLLTIYAESFSVSVFDKATDYTVITFYNGLGLLKKTVGVIKVAGSYSVSPAEGKINE